METGKALEIVHHLAWLMHRVKIQAAGVPEACLKEEQDALNTVEDFIVNHFEEDDTPPAAPSRRIWECECCGCLVLMPRPDSAEQYLCPACRICSCSKSRFTEIPLEQFCRTVGIPYKDPDLCPGCGRRKARTLREMLDGYCPRWVDWPDPDPDAEAACRGAARAGE